MNEWASEMNPHIIVYVSLYVNKLIYCFFFFSSSGSQCAAEQKEKTESGC